MRSHLRVSTTDLTPPPSDGGAKHWADSNPREAGVVRLGLPALPDALMLSTVGGSRAQFRRLKRRRSSSPSPRALFRDLPRDPSVPFLWGHQDRILERYEDHFDTADIALELPTGTGKTLIGLLIAEWRRQARSERTLYLCPTRQLAHQVGALASRYGINANVSLRPGYEGLDAWQSGDAIAVSTYSALFNYRTRFTAPQTLVLDDAHAAEDYVASHWSVKIDRLTMPSVYQELAGLVAPLLDQRTASLTRTDNPTRQERTAVELVPLPRWWPLADAVREIVEEGVNGTSEFFAWDHHVRDGLAACSMLVSWQEMVLRPLVPATDRQDEFAGATQRVYMSATLGAGGELERIFGVRRIQRLPVPDEWERHSTGRRLFLLPAASLRPQEMDDVVVEAVRMAGRAVVLAPTHHAVVTRSEQLSAAGVPTLGAADVEESLDPFTSQPQAALVLANRYDGIDLPGEDCRLLVLDGLPVAVNALEQFLYQRLAATGLLSERMRTRLTQGVGRATRGEGDWCAVLVGSREAYDFCARGEVRGLLHPELQGELQFGIDQSGDRRAQDFLDLLGVLLEHDEDWQAAETEIRELRDASTRGTDPAAAALEAAVAREVDFVYAMWDGNFPEALESAVAVTDALSGDAVAPYRAWWLYQAGAAAWMAQDRFEMPEMLGQARELFRRAAATGRSVHWFAELAYGEAGGEEEEEGHSRIDLRAAERVQDKLRSIGFYGRGLQRRATTLRNRLAGTDSSPWEEGLTQLGQLLGFEASHPGGTNDPDSVWIATDSLAVVWEVKSEEDPSGEIGARTAQQAAGHAAWLRSRHPVSEEAQVFAVLVSDRQRLGEGTAIHAQDVSIVTLDQVRETGERAVAALRRIRSRGQENDDAALRARTLAELSEADLLPSQLSAMFSESALIDLPDA